MRLCADQHSLKRIPPCQHVGEGRSICAEAWRSLLRTFRTKTLLMLRSEAGSAAETITGSMSMNYKTQDNHQATLALKRCREQRRRNGCSPQTQPSSVGARWGRPTWSTWPLHRVQALFNLRAAAAVLFQKPTTRSIQRSSCSIGGRSLNNLRSFLLCSINRNDSGS